MFAGVFLGLPARGSISSGSSTLAKCSSALCPFMPVAGCQSHRSGPLCTLCALGPGSREWGPCPGLRRPCCLVDCLPGQLAGTEANVPASFPFKSPCEGTARLFLRLQDPTALKQHFGTRTCPAHVPFGGTFPLRVLWLLKRTESDCATMWVNQAV